MALGKLQDLIFMNTRRRLHLSLRRPLNFVNTVNLQYSRFGEHSLNEAREEGGGEYSNVCWIGVLKLLYKPSTQKIIFLHKNGPKGNFSHFAQESL